MSECPLDLSVLSQDSTCIKVHPDGTGASKKGTQFVGKPEEEKTREAPKKTSRLSSRSESPGMVSFIPRKPERWSARMSLLVQLEQKWFKYHDSGLYVLKDKAYAGLQTRHLAELLGMIPVIPPKTNRREPWDYDKELYKRRNEVERFFRRIKGYRRICTRYDKLDVAFTSFLYLAMTFELLRGFCVYTT